MRRGLISIALLGMSVVVISARQPPPAQAPQTPPTIRVQTRLVVHNVVVTDKEGKAIEGLTKNDFVVMENNVRQEIAFVEFQRVAAPIERPTEPATPIPVAAPLDVAARTEAARITIPPTGDTRYQD